MTYMIFPYNSASAGAKALAEGLDGYRIKRQDSTYVYKDTDVVINWGASDNPFQQALNAKNYGILSKKAFFERLSETGLTPRWRTDPVAAKMLGCDLVCRQQDQGKDGEGIVLWKQQGDLPSAKLYVELMNKTAEYRVHMGRTKTGDIVIIGQQRKFFSGEGIVWTGEQCKFVWTVDGAPIQLPNVAYEVACKAMSQFPEITFCGLDIIYDSHQNKAWVLEANSAPTLTPKAVDKYVAFITKYYPLPKATVAAPVPVVAEPAAVPASFYHTPVPFATDVVLTQIKGMVTSLLSKEDAKAWAAKEFA